VDENDNNKNRKYGEVSRWISKEYGKNSRASNRNALADPYVKAICWASHRLGDSGVLTFVTNSGFIESIAADGMRQRLAEEFSSIFLLDLGGNVRKNPKLSGTTHNVFGIQVGVSINIFVKRPSRSDQPCRIHYARVDEFWRKEQKYAYLEEKERASAITWQLISPDGQNNWITAGLAQDFAALLGISEIFSAESNGLKTNRDDWAYNFDRTALIANISRTIETYNQEVSRWARRAKTKESVDDFVIKDERQISWSETLKKHVEGGDYITFNENHIRRALYRPFCSEYVYFDAVLNERRYQLQSVFPTEKSDNQCIWFKVGSDWPFFALAADRIPDILPQGGSRCFPFYTYAEDGTNRRENITEWALEQFRTRYGDPSITKWDIFHYVYAVLHHPEYRKRYAANLRRELPRIPFVGIPGAEAQVGGNAEAALKRRSSTDAQSSVGTTLDAQSSMGTTVEERPFRAALSGKDVRALAPEDALKGDGLGRSEISAQDARRDDSLANHPAETKGAVGNGAPEGAPFQGSQVASVPAALDTDLDIFRAFVCAGQRLAEIHVHYEEQPEYPLIKKEKVGEKLDYRIEKMRLSKDKTTLTYNQFLTLSGIPPETYEYRLGNRSALEWVIDQYQVSTDKRSGITNDPNRDEDPQYILRLIGQVITISLETVKIVHSLPPLGMPEVNSAETATAR
jgi:predicted helicase